ncbi:hypothetical protein BJF85_06365 [Saccharomonospora sp. CUA-673]|nr:hypothetical protein BJF85_06365 [Saccharomonospora sp. CUA-673]
MHVPHRHKGERFDDWRARMAVRGGPVTHGLARAGWAGFAALGALIGFVFSVVWSIVTDHVENPGNFLGVMIVFMPLGAALFGVLGAPVQFLARAWLCTPTSAEQDAFRKARRADAPYTEEGLRNGGRWAASYGRCAASLQSFHAIVGALPQGPGRNWLTDVGSTLDDELTEALRLARLGDELAPDGKAVAGTPRRIADLLSSAEESFAQTTDRAAAISLDLHRNPEFESVRAQLDMLAAQTPHLRASGL